MKQEPKDVKELINITRAETLIEFLYTKVQSARGSLGLFMVGDRVMYQNPNSQRFKQALADYPTSIIGVYDKTITINDFREDMLEHFKDMHWI
jgi:hypothetical protein